MQELPESETFLLVLAEDAHSDCQRLEMQISLNDDSGGGELDTYCVSTELGLTHYGGITECRLTAKFLQIMMEDEACKDLGIDGGFTIELSLSEGSLLESLRGGIQRILAKAPCPIKMLVDFN